jgi:glycine dehydrogenase
MDRFCTAMLCIRREIEDVVTGVVLPKDSPLKNAPHTQDMVTADVWEKVYSRETAAFPAPWVKENKFWPTVGRIDNVFGDRNLVCSCPPVESYIEVEVER